VTLAVIVLCAILTFAPVEFIHPVRVAAFRPITLGVTALWSVLAIIALAEHLNPALPVKIALGLATVYLAGIGAVLQLRRKTQAAAPGSR
jgi:phosphatidylcholine synthase